MGAKGAEIGVPAKIAFSGNTAHRTVRDAMLSTMARNVIKPDTSWKWANKNRVRYAYRHKPAKYPGNEPDEADQSNDPVFGRYALKATEHAWITSRQIEMLRRIMVEACGRRCKFYLRLYPYQVHTQRFAESRRGVGKGKYEYWVAAVKPDFILFELDGVPEETARLAFRKAAASNHLRFKCKIVVKEDVPSRFEMDPEFQPDFQPGLRA